MIKTYRAEAPWQTPLLLLTIAAMTSATFAARGQIGAVSLIGLSYALMIVMVLPAVALGAFAMFIARCAARREPAPWACTRELLARLRLSRRLTITILLPLLMMSTLMGAFGAAKSIIPHSNPFYLDDRLAAIDRMLFGGYQPWEWTHAVFGGVRATAALDLIYSAWVPLLFASLIIAGFATRRQRAQFMLTFALAWVLLGMVGSWLLSSAGPCYSALINARSQAEFAPLMMRLAQIDAIQELGAIVWQKELWQAQVERRFGIGVGISAMPSMHNAMTALYVAALWRTGLVSRYASLLFALVIFIGSIHLGWHYAVDGLVSFTVVIALWHAVGHYLRWSGYTKTVNDVTLAQQPA